MILVDVDTKYHYLPAYSQLYLQILVPLLPHTTEPILPMMLSTRRQSTKPLKGETKKLELTLTYTLTELR